MEGLLSLKEIGRRARKRRGNLDAKAEFGARESLPFKLRALKFKFMLKIVLHLIQECSSYNKFHWSGDNNHAIIPFLLLHLPVLLDEALRVRDAVDERGERAAGRLDAVGPVLRLLPLRDRRREVVQRLLRRRHPRGDRRRRRVSTVHRF